MANISDVVRRLRIETTETGVRETTEKLSRLGDGYSDVAKQSETATKATTKYQEMMEKSRRLLEEQEKQQRISTLSMAEYVAIAASATAATVALYGFFDKVRDWNKELADMQTQAKMVGLSLADLQGLKFGAAVAGITDSEVNSGLQKSAQLLNDASRNANTLSKELAENGIAVRQSNGQMITQNQLLGIAADLVKRARNPGDQAAIAQMLGFTEKWIPLLEQGSGAMANLTSEAMRAGAVIDDATIERATEFDRAWRKSSVEFSSYMKAAMLGLLPYLDDLIDRAAKFIKSVDIDSIEAAANKQLKIGADAIGLPEQAAIKFSMPEATIQNWHKLGDEVVGVFGSVRDFANDNSSISMLDKVFSLLTANAPTQGQLSAKLSGLLPKVEVLPQQDYKWYGGTSPVMDVDASISAAKNKAAWQAEAEAYSKLSAMVMAAATTIDGAYSRVAATAAASKGALDRALESIEKYIRVTDAAAKTVGDGVFEQERAKVIAQLGAAAARDGIKDISQYALEWQQLGDRAGQAAKDLAKAKIAAEIKLDGDLIGLSSQDVQIAQKLASVYDNDVTKALGSAEAEAVRLNAPMSTLREKLPSKREDDRDSDLRRQAA